VRHPAARRNQDLFDVKKQQDVTVTLDD